MVKTPNKVAPSRKPTPKKIPLHPIDHLKRAKDQRLKAPRIRLRRDCNNCGSIIHSNYNEHRDRCCKRLGLSYEEFKGWVYYDKHDKRTTKEALPIRANRGERMVDVSPNLRKA